MSSIDLCYQFAFKAIRHYEAIGLIPPPKRIGNRYYSDKDIKAIRMIKNAQKYGFKLSELTFIIARTRSDNNFPYDELIEVIEKKREEIKAEIIHLSEMANGLAELSNQIKNIACSC
jgi:MerR family transcriptional regulator, copper efflux regulator